MINKFTVSIVYLEIVSGKFRCKAENLTIIRKSTTMQVHQPTNHLKAKKH